MPRTFSYNKSIRVETRREKLTGDAGALLSREVLECSGVIPVLAQKLGDPRVPGKIKHSIENLLRAVFLLAAQGRRDHNHADLFRDDPAFRLAVSGRGGTAPLNGRGLPSQPTLSRLAALLAEPGHTEALREMPFRLAAWRMLALDGRLPATLTLDIDSLPVEVHGRQPGSRWNRYYKARIFHPLAASVARTGDLLDLRLREGDVHTAEGGLEYILEVVALARRFLCPNITVRFDAGFPGARLLAGLEEQNISYIARVQTNAVLKRRGEPAVDAVAEDAWLGREPGAKPRTFVKELEVPYQAASWPDSRRVVQVIAERRGQLFPRTFWLLTSFSADEVPASELLLRYRKRGKAEGHFGEFMSVANPSLPSSPRPKSHYRGKPVQAAARITGADAFARNQVRLLVAAAGYQIMHCLRKFLERATRRGWSLRALLERVLRAPARFAVSGRRVTMVLSTVAPRWETIFRKLSGLSDFSPRPRRSRH